MRSKDENKIYEIKRCIESSVEDRGFSPTMQEIADKVGLSKGTVCKYLQEMTLRGIVKNEGGWRGTRTARSESRVLRVPLIGTVACGLPIFAEQNVEETLTFNSSLMGSGEFFALRAKGDSMVGAGIEEGDIVVIKRTRYADEGSIVVSLIGDEVTLKRIFFDKKTHKIRLHAENPAYEDMVFDEVNVQGVATRVIKEI